MNAEWKALRIMRASHFSEEQAKEIAEALSARSVQVRREVALLRTGAQVIRLFVREQEYNLAYAAAQKWLPPKPKE